MSIQDSATENGYSVEDETALDPKLLFTEIDRLRRRLAAAEKVCELVGSGREFGYSAAGTQRWLITNSEVHSVLEAWRKEKGNE